MKRKNASHRPSSLRAFATLSLDIFVARALMWVANPTGEHAFQPHVHLYLADRYGLLTRVCRRLGLVAMARAVEERATLHFAMGGGDEPPPAAAMALARPRSRVERGPWDTSSREWNDRERDSVNV